MNLRYHTKKTQINAVIPGLTRNRALRARRSQSLIDSRFRGNDKPTGYFLGMLSDNRLIYYSNFQHIFNYPFLWMKRFYCT
jgi:hypothetical protein